MFAIYARRAPGEFALRLGRIYATIEVARKVVQRSSSRLYEAEIRARLPSGGETLQEIYCRKDANTPLERLAP